jgi:hypothetical protein
LSKGVQQDGNADALPVQLGSADDLPVEGRLVFFLRSIVPADFPRDEKIEVASVDMSFDTTLAMKDGSLVLENADTAVASLEPLKRFGFSAFGPVQVRAIAADGVAGDWIPLGTFVRIPDFKDLRCPRSLSKPCMLSGSDLFLAASFADSASFDNPTDVPPAFTGMELVVPHPVNGLLYVKLRDDAATVQTLSLPVTFISLPASEGSTRRAHPVVSPTVPAAPSSAPPAAQPEAIPPEKQAPPTAEPSSPGGVPPATPHEAASPAGKPVPATSQPSTPQAVPQTKAPQGGTNQGGQTPATPPGPN